MRPLAAGEIGTWNATNSFDAVNPPWIAMNRRVSIGSALLANAFHDQQR